MQTRSGAVARLIFIDLLGSFAWFPVWWYTRGLVLVIGKMRNILNYRWQSYGFKIWLKNFFVPMYGQHDLTGKLVSLLMRLVVLVGRAIAFAAEAAFYGVGIIFWIALPAALVFLILGNLAVGTFGAI